MGEIGLYEAMSTLRAVRRLRPDPVPDDALRRVLEAASWAPTGGNVQPWRVVAVRDGEKKQKLGALYAERWYAYAEHHRGLLADAPVALREKAERMLASGNHLAEHFIERPGPFLHFHHARLDAGQIQQVVDQPLQAVFYKIFQIFSIFINILYTYIYLFFFYIFFFDLKTRALRSANLLRQFGQQ